MNDLIAKPFAYTSKKGLSSELITDFCGKLPVRTCMCFGDYGHVFDQPIYLNPVIKNGGAPIAEIIDQIKQLDIYTTNAKLREGAYSMKDKVIEILERYR